MKKIFIVLFLIASTFNVSSQSKFQFELLTGMTLSLPKTSNLLEQNIQGAPVIESSLNVGGFILPSFSYSFNDKRSFDFGLGFSLDRFSIVEKNGFTRYEGNRNVLNLQIPLNYNFHFGKNKAYVFGVGAFANILLSAKESGKVLIEQGDINSPGADPVFDSVEEYERDIKEFYNVFSFGAFIQMKRYMSFSSKLKGFLFIKINQHINMMNEPNTGNTIYSFGSEKEPTVINLGAGIKL